MATSGHLSKEFFDVVKRIGDAKSRQQEDRIIGHEIRVLKARLQESNLSTKIMKECLVRLMYVELLGHDAGFAYANVIQMTASGSLQQKQVGYLAAGLMLSPDHEFRVMLVNQILRDLSSSNILEVSGALMAISRLLTCEMIPALLPSLQKLLSHDHEIVRKGTIMAIYAVYLLDPESISDIDEMAKRTLCDRSPAVMAATLPLLHALTKVNAPGHRSMTPSYVNILKQIIEGKLPSSFEYHRVPAPWIQIRVLKILAILGANDKQSSELMYGIILDCMKRATSATYICYAIVYECICTATMIYPNTALLDAAAAAIARFIKSDHHNTKYLGVTTLAEIVREHPHYAIDHQMIVLDCLEDSDETMRRKTLNLLARMTNPVNVEVIVDKLIFYLKDTTDKLVRKNLVTRICELAERFAPSHVWYVGIIAQVFELGGDMVDETVMHSLLQMLGEGIGDDDTLNDEGIEEKDCELRTRACEIFLDALVKPKLPDSLLCIAFWTIGEYSYLLGSETLSGSLFAVCEYANREGISSKVRCYAASSLMKLCAQMNTFPDVVVEFLDRFSLSMNVELQQKCCEFREITRTHVSLLNVFPVDASTEDFEEPDFDFLRDSVEKAKAAGFMNHNPPRLDELDSGTFMEGLVARSQKSSTGSRLKYDAYAKPEFPPKSTHSSRLNYDAYAKSKFPLKEESPESSLALDLNGEQTSFQNNNKPENFPATLDIQASKNVWGASGYGGSGPGAGVISTPARANVELETPKSAVSLKESVVSKDDSAVRMENTTRENLKPRAATERERMAAALFQGISGDTSRELQPSGNPRMEISRTQRSDENISNQTRERKVSDLLDLNEDEPEILLDSHATIHDSVGADLLSMDFSLSADINSEGLGGQDAQARVGLMTSNLPYTGKAIDTQQFGKLWGKCSASSDLSLPMLLCSISEAEEKIKASLGLSLIEAIYRTREAILAGVESASGETVLLHIKKSVTNVDLKIRSSDMDIVERLKSRCKSALESLETGG